MSGKHGGARIPGPGKKNGRPRKDPAEALVKKGPYWLPPDIVEILDRQKNMTHYIIEAVRAYNLLSQTATICSGSMELQGRS
jgi:hypothetical protein